MKEEVNLVIEGLTLTPDNEEGIIDEKFIMENLHHDYRRFNNLAAKSVYGKPSVESDYIPFYALNLPYWLSPTLRSIVTSLNRPESVNYYIESSYGTVMSRKFIRSCLKIKKFYLVNIVNFNFSNESDCLKYSKLRLDEVLSKPYMAHMSYLTSSVRSSYLHYSNLLQYDQSYNLMNLRNPIDNIRSLCVNQYFSGTIDTSNNVNILFSLMIKKSDAPLFRAAAFSGQRIPFEKAELWVDKDFKFEKYKGLKTVFVKSVREPLIEKGLQVVCEFPAQDLSDQIFDSNEIALPKTMADLKLFTKNIFAAMKEDNYPTVPRLEDTYKIPYSKDEEYYLKSWEKIEGDIKRIIMVI